MVLCLCAEQLTGALVSEPTLPAFSTETTFPQALVLTVPPPTHTPFPQPLILTLFASLLPKGTREFLKGSFGISV